MLSECSFAGTVTRCTWFVIRHQPSKRTSAWIRFSRMSRRQVLRSWSSENVIRRSTPRWVTWLAAPGSTQRARLGIGAQLYTFTENRAVQAVPFSPARPVRILSDLHLALAHHIPRSWSTSSRTSLGLISTGYPELSRTTSTWSAGVPDSIRHVPFFSDTDFVVPPSTRSYVPSA